MIFMLLPECHFHTGFLIGIKLIQISVLNIVIHAGAIQIIFLSIQLFEDFTKSFMDQQITFQENATYKRKRKQFRPKMGFCVTVCVQRKFIQICLVHLSLFGLCHSIDDMSKLKLCIQTIPRVHILSKNSQKHFFSVYKSCARGNRKIRKLSKSISIFRFRTFFLKSCEEYLIY